TPLRRNPIRGLIPLPHRSTSRRRRAKCKPSLIWLANSLIWAIPRALGTCSPRCSRKAILPRGRKRNGSWIRSHEHRLRQLACTRSCEQMDVPQVSYPGELPRQSPRTRSIRVSDGRLSEDQRSSIQTLPLFVNSWNAMYLPSGDGRAQLRGLPRSRSTVALPCNETRSSAPRFLSIALVTKKPLPFGSQAIV